MINGSVLSMNLEQIPLNDNESQEAEWSKQREERGFDDRELWNLDATILKFIIPRLKAFREMERWGTPCGISVGTWHIILDRIIEGFQLYLDDEWTTSAELDYIMKKYKISMKLFAKWFCGLWD